MSIYNIAREPDFTDIDLSLTRNRRTRDIATISGIDAIVTSVENLVNMNFYEKPFQPHIGSNVRKLLFENITAFTASFIESAVGEVIVNFEPRVKLIQVTAIPTPEENGYDVHIVFGVNGAERQVQINTFLTRVR